MKRFLRAIAILWTLTAPVNIALAGGSGAGDPHQPQVASLAGGDPDEPQGILLTPAVGVRDNGDPHEPHSPHWSRASAPGGRFLEYALVFLAKVQGL